jgi:hypothetical protein
VGVIERIWPWESQPQGAAELNPDLGIRVALSGGAFGHGIGYTETPAVSTGITRVATQQGIAYSTSNTVGERVLVAANVSSLLGSQGQTFAFLRRCRDTTSRDSGVFGAIQDSSNTAQVVAPFTDGNLYFDYGNSNNASGGGRISVAYTKDTFWETLVFVANGGRGREVWRRGVRIAADTSRTAAPPAGGAAFGMFGRGVGGSVTSDAVDYALGIVAGIAWTPDQIRAWSADPFGVTFAPRRVSIPYTAAAPALPTLTALARTNPLRARYLIG